MLIKISLSVLRPLRSAINVTSTFIAIAEDKRLPMIRQYFRDLSNRFIPPTYIDKRLVIDSFQVRRCVYKCHPSNLLLDTPDPSSGVPSSITTHTSRIYIQDTVTHPRLRARPYHITYIRHTRILGPFSSFPVSDYAAAAYHTLATHRRQSAYFQHTHVLMRDPIDVGFIRLVKLSIYMYV